MPKKKFIDKKKAVTFHLVHRSQKDPLQADEDAPKHVLLPTKDTIDDRKLEQSKYGILFDDEYDYLQHLKDTDELNDVEPVECYRVYVKEDAKEKGRELTLPSSVFGTDVETDVGLLNKAAPLRGPQPDWDPDIVEALDDDFDFDNPENDLDDDFFIKANDQVSPENEENVFKPPIEELEGSDSDNDGDYPSDEADLSDDDGDDDASDVGSLGEKSFMSAETKTRFTSYSMTSSVIRRNEGLQLLDDRFEQLFEQYDDTEIGALDQEDITGFIQDNDLLMEDALQQWEKGSKKVTMKDLVEKAEDVGVASDSGSDTEEEVIEVNETRPEEKWDCESILSTYSNLYNHPKKIVEPSKKGNPIKLTKRIGIPDDVLSERGPTLKQLEKEQRMERLIEQAPTERPKNESKEDRKVRKQAVKEQRRERREEKKMNKVAFKQEEMRQHKELVNLHKNLKSVKIV